MSATPDNEDEPTAGKVFVRPSVSVVVPLVDRVEFAKRAVRAILDQAYDGPVECIVVLDGENDYDLGFVSTGDRAVRVIRNFRPKGLAGARNSGYLTSEATYLANCDDDDEWLPGKLSAQIDLALSRPDASLIATGSVIRFEGKDTVREAPKPQFAIGDFLRTREFSIPSSSFLMHRQRFLDTVGLVDEALPGGYAEDYEMLLRASRTGPVLCVTGAMTRVNWHSSSFYARRWEMISDALRHLLDVVPEFKESPEGLARIEGQIAFANAAMGNRREALRLARASVRKSWRAKHSYAAMAVATGVVSADQVLALARRRGRGV